MRIEEIIGKFEQINQNIELIRENLPNVSNEFENMVLVKDGIYKRLEYSIELVLDICSIVNRDLRLGIPNSESDIISNLVKDKIISPEIEEKIKGMKAFRNILVHKYGKIDDKLVFEILKKHLTDFKAFEEGLMNYIRENYELFKGNKE